MPLYLGTSWFRHSVQVVVVNLCLAVKQQCFKCFHFLLVHSILLIYFPCVSFWFITYVFPVSSLLLFTTIFLFRLHLWVIFLCYFYYCLFYSGVTTACFSCQICYFPLPCDFAYSTMLWIRAIFQSLIRRFPLWLYKDMWSGSISVNTWPCISDLW